ncbi:hypothetical protein PR001_g13271 [Phytophthora rubi]|nr:hypothetical protein PR001_g13271 [Phytophthora rubi]
MNHYNPVCVKNAAGYSVSDCTNYNRGGWDDFDIANNAFNGYSFLGVEQYVQGRCGSFDSIASAKLYRLDENCYSNAAGTESHQLTLGHSATITTFSDGMCGNVATTTTVRQAAMGASRASFCVDEVTAFFGGSQPNLTALAVYDDYTCSSSPSQLKFVQDFVCKTPTNVPCQSEGRFHYSVAGCTSDFLGYAATAFGSNTPYVVVEDFANPWCNDVEFVTIYLADGSCHTNPDDATSFRATINVADSSATITTYSDTSCNFVASDTFLDSQTLSTSPCLRRDCEFWFGCGQRYAVGGLEGPPSMGKKTVVVEYANSSCSSPAMTVAFKSALTCAPQTDHYDPTCVNGGLAYSVSDCSSYSRGGWDDLSIAYNAFNGYSYLGVEIYVPGRCGVPDSIASAKLYRLDENCYPNAAGTESHRLTLDHSATITTYSDATCTTVATTTTIRQAAMGVSRVGFCVDEVTAFFGGTPPNLTTIAIYDDNTCSSSPTQLKFSQDFTCRAPENAPCQSEGNSHFSVSSCTSNFLDYADEQFGSDTPYIVVEDFPNPWCNDVEFVTIYTADGSCHSNADDATSFRATINTADGTATIMTYSDASCSLAMTGTSLDSQTLSTSPCLPRSCEFWYGCGKRYAVGGLGGPPSMGKKTVVIEYANSSCSSPAMTVSFTSELTCAPQTNHYDPVCVKGAAAYSVSDCTNYNRGGWDDLSIANDAFNGYSYLGVEQYVSGRCGVGDSIVSAKLFRLDENCYPNAARTESHRLTLGHTATITTYNDGRCGNVATTTTVRQAAIGASRVGFCVDELTAYFGGSRPNLTVVAIYDESTCSSSPSQLKFSQDFVCKSPTNAPCQSQGSSHFSVSSCASDFLGYATTVFGWNTPYLIVEDFPNPWCNDVEFVTIYTADGSCHSNADDSTSFRVTINTADGTATVTTYSDPACNFVASDTYLDSQTLSTSPCLSRGGCEYWFGCGRRYVMGGLSGPPTVGKKTALVLYEDSWCAVTPVVLVISNTFQCTSPAAPVCDTLFNGPNTVYQTRECIDSVDTYVSSKFQSTPYLIAEYYANGTNCQVQTNVTMYAADGKCHLSIYDGTYFTITQRSDGAVIASNYPTPLCKDTDAVVYVLDYWNVNTGTCMGDRIFRTSQMPLATNVSTPATTTPPPSTWTPTPTPTQVTEVPVEDDIEARLNIMFPAWLWDPLPPQAFVNDGRRHHRSPSHRRP